MKETIAVVVGDQILALGNLENNFHHTFAVPSGTIASLKANVGGTWFEIDTNVTGLAMYQIYGVSAFSVNMTAATDITVITG